MSVKWHITKACQSDDREVYRLLLDSFFKYEPITSKFRPLAFEESLAIKTLSQGHSFKAVDERGRIVGVSLNYEVDNVPAAPEVTDPEYFKLFDMFELARIKMGRPFAPGLMSLHLLCVDTSHRKKGLAKALIEETENHAEKNGFTGVKIECTSKFSSAAVQSRGYRLLYSLPYEDYKDECGNPYFSPDYPHKEFQIFVKMFDSNRGSDQSTQ